MINEYSSLKFRLSQEWSKPKAKNVKKRNSPTARDYKEIKRLQIQINEHKVEMNK